MPNLYKNKVIYGNLTLMDITDTSASPNTVLEGEVFYSASGARSVGTVGDVTHSTHGLMTAADKIKLDSMSGNVYTDYTINIQTTDWIESNGEYTYDWMSNAITSGCLVGIIFDSDPQTVLTGSLDFEKITGGLEFTTDGEPIGTLTIIARVIDSTPNVIANNTATQSNAGFMSATDKLKLDNLVILTKTTEQWNADLTYVPPAGAIIIYSDYSSSTDPNTGETIYKPNIKIGDGNAYCVDLPFLNSTDGAYVLNLIDTHAANTTIHVTAAEKQFWNNKLNCTISGEELIFNRL